MTIFNASWALLGSRPSRLCPTVKQMFLRLSLVLLSSLALCGCRQPARPPINPDPPKELWKSFSGVNALEHVRQQVQLGPRPAGSEAIEKTRIYTSAKLKEFGWTVERQEFEQPTPRGPVRFVNLIARFGDTPQNAPQAIVCSHFDTKFYETIRFLGANDAGSSTGALIELARVLSLDPKLAANIELVFFDGEEAFQQFSESDGTYGSRYYARQLKEANRQAQYKFTILWDMIGDKDLRITLCPNSPRELVQGIFASSESVGLREIFTFHDRPIWDDHVPLNEIGIPSIDLIDFDFPAWHTADDNLEQLSAQSLEKVAAVTIHFLKSRF